VKPAENDFRAGFLFYQWGELIHRIVRSKRKNMRRMKLIIGILIALSLMVWTVQPILACGSTSGDGGDDHSGSGVATKLVFIHQPTNAASGTSISPAVTVAVQDAHGNTITGSTLAITMAIRNNPSGGKLSGTTKVNAVKGVATFTNLSIDKPGTGYTLKASTGYIITGSSNAFNITGTPSIPIVTTPVVTSPNITPPVVTTPVAGTAPAWLQVTVTGLIVNSPPVLIDQGGYIHGNYELTSKDGTVTLDLPENNGCWNSAGQVLTSISAGITTAPPATTNDDAMVLAYTFGPDGANFNPALTLTLKYDPAITTANVLENSLYAEGYDGTRWQRLDGVINKAQKTITIQISHFSTYAVMGKVMPPPPVTAIAAPPTTNAINDVVSLAVSVPETNPSSSSLLATIDASSPDVVTTPEALQQTPAPNLPVSSQPDHASLGLFLVGLAAALALIILLVVWIMRRRAERE
jgi:hypothetical protein